jgi:hypothetical protein
MLGVMTTIRNRETGAAFAAAMIAVLVIQFPSLARAEVTVVAEAYPTPGVLGFTTYDLVARSSEGIFVGYDFTNHNGAPRGIFGPLHQEGDVYATQLADTGWLTDLAEGLDLGVSESASALYGAYVFKGVHAQQNTRTEWLFARLVTDSPADVQLVGQFAIKPLGGTMHDAYIVNVNSTLASIALTDVAATPEPTSAASLLSAITLGFSFWRRRRSSV